MAAKTTAKKPKASALPLKERAVEAALSLAGRMGWDMVTMTDVADAAGVGLADLREIFDDKTDILVAYGRIIDRRVLESYGGPDPSMPERERLFEILMERFDVMGENRAAILSMLKSLGPDPKQAVIGLPHLGRSMAWMLEAAGIETAGIKGAIRVAGLSAVYLYVLKIWMSDESEDQSRTMAALDKTLARAQQCANSFML